MQKCVITAGGLAEVTNTLCNIPELYLEGLISTREEVDIPLELHWLHSPSADVVVFFKDTYALMLLLAHYPDVHQKKILTAWNLHV